MVILPSIPIDSSAALAKYFMPHQSIWIQADDYLHAEGKQAFALAEKSVRVGWTFGDSVKNVRKRLHYPRRDYLFATKDYASALEYMSLAERATEVADVLLRRRAPSRRTCSWIANSARQVCAAARRARSSSLGLSPRRSCHPRWYSRRLSTLARRHAR